VSLRAGAALALSGRYSVPGRGAAAGLRAWAQAVGVGLEIVDDRSDPARSAAATAGLARRVDLLFGPYGSGPARAAAAALVGRDAVMWNHGGAEVPRGEVGRVVDVLGPARRYWRGLAEALGGIGADPDRVVLVRGATPFGRAVSAGAERSLAEAGHRPLAVLDIDGDPEAAVARAERAGAGVVVGSGRIEDDLALGGALAGRPLAVGLVVCGIDLAAERLGDAVEGWIGPSQSDPDAVLPSYLRGIGAGYPGVQAAAAGELARSAVETADSTEPDAVWEAARAMRLSTFLGPFRVDERGRQVAHAPRIVRWIDGRRRSVWAPPG
jgi:ABC-type branched-subunit amino acid transport system substrate-binding protein